MFKSARTAQLANRNLTRVLSVLATTTVRGWIYQRERFPLFSYGLLIASFSFCLLAYSAMARGHVHIPDVRAVIVAFCSAFLFFLQLRIADEYKDYQDDVHWRPYRPVPRGLVSLNELGAVAICAALVQLLLALWLSPGLLPLLLLVWGYLGMMSMEFFATQWLKARPLAYLLSHMGILPVIDLYGTACDWQVASSGPPSSLILLLLVSYLNGLVLEIGRKVRAPQDEEKGVETYSRLWGRKRAILSWYTALLATAGMATLAAGRIGFALPVAGIALGLLLVAGVHAARFLYTAVSGGGKTIETISGVWTLLMYLSLGAIPLAWKLVH